jgi:hypothetical protein
MGYIHASSFFGASTGGGGGGGAQLTSADYSEPMATFQTLRFARNGGLSLIGSISGTTALVNWWLPTNSTIGDSYEVKCTLTSGTFATGVSGTWYTINTNRDFGVGESRTALFNCQIRRLSDSVVVASGTFSLDTIIEGGGGP